MKTFSAKPSDVSRQWLVVDATDIPLGRLATFIATRLTGKHKPMFTQHIDVGDYVVVINASNVKITGNKKLIDKTYYRHSGYPGNLKEQTLADKLISNPEEVVYLAVKGMLPKNKLQDSRLERLKIYRDSNHKHSPQKPIEVTIKGDK